MAVTRVQVRYQRRRRRVDPPVATRIEVLRAIVLLSLATIAILVLLPAAVDVATVRAR